MLEMLLGTELWLQLLGLHIRAGDFDDAYTLTDSVRSWSLQYWKQNHGCRCKMLVQDAWGDCRLTDYLKARGNVVSCRDISSRLVYAVQIALREGQ